MQILINKSTNKNIELLKQRNETNPKQNSDTGAGSFFYLICRHVAHNLQSSQGDWLLSSPVTPSCVQRRDSDLRLCISLYFICT